jgi:hypothetical protein
MTQPEGIRFLKQEKGHSSLAFLTCGGKVLALERVNYAPKPKAGLVGFWLYNFTFL